MAVRSNVRYISRFVRRKLGLGSYLTSAATAASNPTSLRVVSPQLFDPGGGTLYYVNQSGVDKYFTYTGMNFDQLTGIPASGDGEIDSDVYGFAEATNTPTLVYRGDIDDEELEVAIDTTKRFVVEELFSESSEELKRWKTVLGWFDTDAQIRDSDDDSYTVITLGGSDTISYERGEVIFNTARTENQLWLAGFAFNPYDAIARLIMQYAGDARFMSYLQVGQVARSQKSAVELAQAWRAVGVAINLLR